MFLIENIHLLPKYAKICKVKIYIIYLSMIDENPFSECNRL